MCDICFAYAGDEHDWTVARIAGHHPNCPHFAINKVEFSANFVAAAQEIADKKLAAKVVASVPHLPEPKPQKELTEARVQIGLFWYANRKGHDHIVPNIELYHTGESDLLSVMKSGLACEYEIKLSRADFKKDFSKTQKHAILRRELVTYNSRLSVNFNFDYTFPNYFYYVCPKDLIKPQEVPDYAGLIYFAPASYYYAFEVVRKARRLHKNPITEQQKDRIAKSLMWRCWTAREKNEKETI